MTEEEESSGSNHDRILDDQSNRNSETDENLVACVANQQGQQAPNSSKNIPQSNIRTLTTLLHDVILKLEELMPFDALVHSMNDSERTNVVPVSTDATPEPQEMTLVGNIPYFLV